MCPPTTPLGQARGQPAFPGKNPPQPSGGDGTGEVLLILSRSPDGHDVREREMSDRKGLELLEEPQVVFVEETDVVNPILQHGQTLGAHSKGKTRIHLRIVADEAIQGGMHHT